MDSSNDLSFSSKPWPPPDPPPVGQKTGTNALNRRTSHFMRWSFPVREISPSSFAIRYSFTISAIPRFVVVPPPPPAPLSWASSWLKLERPCTRDMYLSRHPTCTSVVIVVVFPISLSSMAWSRPELSSEPSHKPALIIRLDTGHPSSRAPPPPLAQQTSSHQEHQTVETVSTEIYNTPTSRSQPMLPKGKAVCLSVSLSHLSTA